MRSVTRLRFRLQKSRPRFHANAENSERRRLLIPRALQEAIRKYGEFPGASSVPRQIHHRRYFPFRKAPPMIEPATENEVKFHAGQNRRRSFRRFPSVADRKFRNARS